LLSRPDPAVAGLERPVEKQLAGEVALPQVVLQIETLLSEIRGTESSTKCLVRMGEKPHAGERRILGSVVVEEVSELGLFRMLPAFAGYLLEIPGDRSARGQRQEKGGSAECFQLVSELHRDTVARDFSVLMQKGAINSSPTSDRH
jgi:hypothetical protein